MVETLVSIVIIGIVVAIALPALSGVRRLATTLKCQSRLSSIGTMYELHASAHNGLWATKARPIKEDPILLTWGTDSFHQSPAWEMTSWAVSLDPYVGDEDSVIVGELYSGDYAPVSGDVRLAGEAFSCPVVFDSLIGEFRQTHPNLFSPRVLSVHSYLRSPALFTEPSAWRDPSDPPDLNAAFAPVRRSDVAHPSSKTVLVERRAHHHPDRPDITRAGGERFNILAADGHVVRRRAADAAEAMPFTVNEEVPYPGEVSYADMAVPYTTTIDGALGRDW